MVTAEVQPGKPLYMGLVNMEKRTLVDFCASFSSDEDGRHGNRRKYMVPMRLREKQAGSGLGLEVKGLVS